MEEIEYKLKKKNSILIVNAVAKLVDNVQQKKDSMKITLIPEFKLLNEKCKDVEPLVSITACQGIVSLVEIGALPLGSALCQLITALVSARNYTGIITAVGNLLVIDLRAHLLTEKTYRCPFSIQPPQHPLITILKLKKDMWLDIFNQIQFMCNHDDEIVANNSVELLHPVLLYILCGPSHLPVGCRRQTWELLLRLKQAQVSDFLLEVLSWLRLDSETDLESTIFMYMELCEVAIERKDTALCTAMAPSLASLTHQMVCFGHDPRYCVSLLAQLLKAGKESSSCVLMMLSETVVLCPAIYLKDIFVVCKLLVEDKACSAISVRMLECALIQWLVYPSYFTGEAVDLGNDILNVINETRTWGSHTSRFFTNKYFAVLRPMDTRINFAAHLSLLAEVWQSNPTSLEHWLERVAAAPKLYLEKLHLFLLALFVHSTDQVNVRVKCFKLLLKMVQEHNELSGNMLTLILYKLADETEPKVQLELLRGLTQMAVSKENVTLILHTLETLKNKSSLKSLVIDLYLQLWKVENRCYPFLEKMLQEENKGDEDTWELEIARASAIKQICEILPEPHSAEMLKILSEILTRCVDNQGSLASSLALQAVTILCKADIVNIMTAWKKLAPKLNKDERPLVVKSWCEFCGTALSLRFTTSEYEKFKNEVIMKLWSYVLNSEDIEIVNTAFSCLSNAKLDQLSLRTLPECFRRDLRLPRSYAKTPVDAAKRPEDVLTYIPSECWIQMLQNIKPEALEAAGKMLTSWLSTELDSCHYIHGRMEPTSYRNLLPQSICQGLVKCIQNYTPEDKLVVKECIRVLSQDYPRPLPPLDWTFLQEFLQEPELQEYCITLLTKQAAKSPSAQKLLEDFIIGINPNVQSRKEVLTLFANLGDLCNSIPPNVLKPFIEKSLHTAFEHALSGDSGQKMENELKELLHHVKSTLKKQDIHDANKTTLAVIAEGLLEKLDVDNPFFTTYVDCAIELPTKYLERISSPSVWWEVTADKLRLAVQIRSALAQKADTDVPLVWINEYIDATATLSGEHTNVLKSVASVMASVRGHTSNSGWTLELMGQIDVKINAKSDSEKQQIIMFLCDVFIMTVIIMSGFECFAVTLENIASSRETRLQLFPQALANLLVDEQWKTISSQMVAWLFQMWRCPAVPPLYARIFHRALMSLRHDTSLRLQFIDFRPIKID